MSKINILFFEKIDSTNTYVKNNVGQLPVPSIIIADEQTAGRGRRGNNFYSPKKTGLYMTLLIEEPQSCELITPSVAVAVCKTLEGYGIRPKIKWVNDLFLDEKKVCGILCERIVSDKKTFIAVGVGINLTTKTFPDNLSQAGSINLSEDKIVLAENIAKEIITQINSSDTVSEYRKRLFILGREITYFRNGSLCIAEALDINESCNLLVRNNDGTERILSSGEISIKI